MEERIDKCIRELENASTMLNYSKKLCDRLYYLDVMKSYSTELRRLYKEYDRQQNVRSK